MGAVVLLLWVPLRQRPGVGTVANILVIAVSVDLASAWLPDDASLPVRSALLIGGVVINEAIESVKRWRAERDNPRVAAALEALREAARLSEASGRDEIAHSSGRLRHVPGAGERELGGVQRDAQRLGSGQVPPGAVVS